MDTTTLLYIGLAVIVVGVLETGKANAAVVRTGMGIRVLNGVQRPEIVRKDMVVYLPGIRRRIEKLL